MASVEIRLQLGVGVSRFHVITKGDGVGDIRENRLVQEEILNVRGLKLSRSSRFSVGNGSQSSIRTKNRSCSPSAMSHVARDPAMFTTAVPLGGR